MIVWPKSLFEVKETDPREQLTDNLKVGLGIGDKLALLVLMNSITRLTLLDRAGLAARS